jgi:hypothetical protein
MEIVGIGAYKQILAETIDKSSIYLGMSLQT